MPEATPVPYARLPGSGLARQGGSIIVATRTSCRLWLGDDHLLQVESAGGYSESYKRFYFRDIQALYLHKTNSWSAVNLTLGTVTALFLFWTLAVKNTPGIITLGIITAFFGLFLFLNVLRGPTCKCFLQSAVHKEELPSLRRRGNAEKVLARLRPLIEAAQGSASAEALAPQYAALLENARATPAAPGQFSRASDPVASKYDSRAHRLLFLSLLAVTLSETLNIFLPCVPVILLKLIVGSVVAGAVLVALVKQHNTDLKPAIGVLTWITGGLVALDWVSGYIVMIVLTPTLQGDNTQWGYIKGLAGLKPFQTPWWLTMLCVNAALAGVFGLTGLLLLRQHWREKETVA